MKDIEARLKALEARVVELEDRQEIQTVINLVARAVDRCDADLLRSCYHQDAYEAHHMWNGNVADWVEYIVREIAKVPNCRHEIGTPLIEFDGDRAFVETKYDVISRVPLDDGRFVDFTNEGRYLDIFERRNGAWKITYRHLVYDATRSQVIDRVLMAGEKRPPPPESAIARPDKRDPSYKRFNIIDLKPAPFSSGEPWASIRAHFATRD
jgi:ketosteroid isomerase-like protein